MTIKKSSKQIGCKRLFLSKRWLQASAVLVVLLSAATLQAQVKVLEIRDLDVPDGTYSGAVGINNRGQVVGTLGVWAPFLWTESGGMQALPCGEGIAYRINDRSQVAGWCTTAEGERHAALWEPGPAAYMIRDLGALGGGWSIGRNLNHRGQVVGESQVPSGEFHAFLWTRTKGMRDLHSPSLGGESYAFGINDLGQIVGSIVLPSSPAQAVIWVPRGSGFTMHKLGTLPGFYDSGAAGINNRGEVSGTTFNDWLYGPRRAVLWTRSATGYTVQDLGELPGSNNVTAEDINELGMVTGYAWGDPGTFRAFVWTRKGGMQDLGTLPGFQYGAASAINNRGQVVGSNDTEIGGVRHATLWRLSFRCRIGFLPPGF